MKSNTKPKHRLKDALNRLKSHPMVQSKRGQVVEVAELVFKVPVLIALGVIILIIFGFSFGFIFLFTAKALSIIGLFLAIVGGIGFLTQSASDRTNFILIGLGIAIFVFPMLADFIKTITF